MPALLPFAFRLAARVVIVAGAAWVGTRAIQARGNPKDTWSAIRTDVVATYQFLTTDQVETLKKNR